MLSNFVLIWISALVVSFLLLLLGWELLKNIKQRKDAEMFGFEAFEEKKSFYNLDDKEASILEKLVRHSSFSNKDALFNSALLFEEAVNNFYTLKGVSLIRKETLDIIRVLRQKLGFYVDTKGVPFTSTRQLVPKERVNLLFESIIKEQTEILELNEYSWTVAYSGHWTPNYQSLVGASINVRWTRPEDAVYYGDIKVLKAFPDKLELSHLVDFEKVQLRRWLREPVLFPLEAFITETYKLEGMLFDLSAGGVLLGLPTYELLFNEFEIQFELPNFGVERVKIEILSNLSKKKEEYSDLYLYTAVFSGEFGRIQERVLQYLIEVHKNQKKQKNREEKTPM